MGWYIGLGTIPIAIFGFIFKDQIESGARNLYLIGSALIVLGLVLLATPSASPRATRDLELRSTGATASSSASRRRWRSCPGVSRSGATITAGLFRGFDRESAARYSFLLSVPAVVLSGLFELRKIGEGARRGPDRDRHAARLRRRLRVDRLAAALPRAHSTMRSSWPTASVLGGA
jgi:undecaprenyl-diphosphatase